MFDIQYTNQEYMFEETQLHLNEIKGIDRFKELQDAIYGKMDYLGWWDDRIEKIEYYQNKLTVTLVHEMDDMTINDKLVNTASYMFVFYDVELYRFSIATYKEHFIDDITIQQNPDGKYSISFGNGELDFRYSSAEAKHCGVYHI